MGGEGGGRRSKEGGGCGRIVLSLRGWKVVVLGSRTVALRHNEFGMHWGGGGGG